MAETFDPDAAREFLDRAENILDLFHTGTKALEAGIAQMVVVDGRTIEPTEIADLALRNRMAQVITRTTLIHSVLDAEMEGPTIGEVLAGGEATSTTDQEELVGFDIVAAAEAALRNDGEA